MSVYLSGCAQVFALRSQVDSSVFLVAPIAVGVLADATSLSNALWLSTVVMSAALLGRRWVAGRHTVAQS
jgi:hypothetical protein